MKKSGFWTEFRQFIAKGNVMNLAVGVIIGAAFQAITTSLVNDIISPVIGLFFIRSVQRCNAGNGSLPAGFRCSKTDIF